MFLIVVPLPPGKSPFAVKIIIIIIRGIFNVHNISETLSLSITCMERGYISFGSVRKSLSWPLVYVSKGFLVSGKIVCDN
jgi:hypothetical protein